MECPPEQAKRVEGSHSIPRVILNEVKDSLQKRSDSPEPLLFFLLKHFHNYEL
jgi:hypothetical protein